MEFRAIPCNSVVLMGVGWGQNFVFPWLIKVVGVWKTGIKSYMIVFNQ